MNRWTFPKRLRLVNRGGYRRVSRYGKRLVGRLLVIERAENLRPVLRLGITVSKRYGKAHQRNRFKRCVREAFRLIQHRLPPGTELVVKPRSAAEGACLQDFLDEFETLLLTEAPV